jgi:hypothetical protein
MGSHNAERSLDAGLAEPMPTYARDELADAPALARLRAVATTGGLRALPWWAAWALAGVYLAVFVVQLPRNITELAWNSDYASGFTVPESLVRTGLGGGHIVMGAAAEWVPLWFGLLTARLPLHRELWGVMPTLLFLATACTVGWSVKQLAGTRAAVLATLMIVVASPLALAFFMAPVAHNAAYPCTALLGAYLIWLSRGEGRRRLTTLAVPPLAGVAVGLCLASDVLLASTALIPLGVTALLSCIQRDRRARIAGACALTTLAVSIPVAKLTSAIMESLGYLKVPTPTKLAPLAELPARAKLLFKGLKALFNGYLGPERPGALHVPLGLASDVVLVAALLALLGIGARVTVRFVLSGVRSHDRRMPSQLARSLHVIYWTSSALAVCFAFWLFAETGDNTNAHEAYYATVLFSVAAVVPLLLRTSSTARWLLPTFASVFFIAGFAGLTSNYMNISSTIAPEARQVERVARATGVNTGYGGYWEASSMTWNTDGRVTVRPVMSCENPSGASICDFYLVAVPSWYTPLRRRSFLLVKDEEEWVGSLPSGLGKPTAVYNFGALHMYVYPYDIASRLGPSPY